MARFFFPLSLVISFFLMTQSAVAQERYGSTQSSTERYNAKRYSAEQPTRNRAGGATSPYMDAPARRNPMDEPAMQDPGGPPPPPPEQIPVDGGLALLAAAGAGYAVRKLRQRGDEDATS